MSESIVFTSGKGGVGKTTSLANIGVGLALLDKKVLMIDTDMGLRNLDVVMGMESQINYNIYDLLDKKCHMKQAIIKDKRFPGLHIIPGTVKTFPLQKYENTFADYIRLFKQDYDYILIDCPAGIDAGFHFSTNAADVSFVVTTPHISSIRDAGRTIYELNQANHNPIHLLINEYDSRLAKKRQLLSKKDIEEILELTSFGIIPYDKHVITSQNVGIPIIAESRRISDSYMKICKKIVKNGLHIVEEKEFLYEAL